MATQKYTTQIMLCTFNTLNPADTNPHSSQHCLWLHIRQQPMQPASHTMKCAATSPADDLLQLLHSAAHCQEQLHGNIRLKWSISRTTRASGYQNVFILYFSGVKQQSRLSG